jgi:hypothetical protein
LAHEGLGDFRAAALCFSEVERDMNGEPIMLDWYWRLALDWGVSGLAVATGSHGEGVRSAGQFLERALSTDEKVWHALAWERMAQVSLLGGHHDDALAHLDAAFEATSGFDTPLADWRLHRTLAVVQLARGDTVASTQARGRYAECRIRLSRSISREKEVGIRLSVLDVGELF